MALTELTSRSGEACACCPQHIGSAPTVSPSLAHEYFAGSAISQGPLLHGKVWRRAGRRPFAKGRELGYGVSHRPPPPPLSSGNFLNTTATGAHGWYCKLAGLSRTLMRERRRRPLGTGMRDADITLQIAQGTGADEQCVGCDVLAPKAPASTLSNKRNKPNNESEHNFRTNVLRPQAWGAQHKTTLVGNLWPETQAYANNSLRRLSCSARPCSFQ